MRIHHGDQKFTDAQMKKMMEGMWKIMLAEFIAGFIMIMTLDFLIKVLPPGLAPGEGPALAGAHAGFLVWLGFVLPTMISTVIWGGDMKKWMATKIAVSASYRLIVLLVAGYVLGTW